MSYGRSFPRMSIDELVIKRANDEHRLQVLEEGPMAQFRKHGVMGYGDAWYALRHSVPSNERWEKMEYLRDQIEQDDRELETRTGERPSAFYQRILDTELNSATGLTLRQVRRGLRHERIAHDHADPDFDDNIRWRREGIGLAAQAVIGVGDSIADSFHYVTDAAGRAGAAVSGFVDTCGREWRAVGTVGFLALSAYCGYHWLAADKVYQPIAQAYEESHEVGQHALPLKREVAELNTLVTLNCLHTDEMTISIDDDEITIPEKLSNPTAAVNNIRQMDRLVMEHLGDGTLHSLEEVTGSDRKSLAHHRTAALAHFDSAANLLSFAVSRHESYLAEASVASSGNDEVQGAVHIFEGYMDPKVVEEENKAHAVMAGWKYATWGSLGGFGIFLFNLVRGTRRRRHYGF
jgi:hypothetical protein